MTEASFTRPLSTLQIGEGNFDEWTSRLLTELRVAGHSTKQKVLPDGRLYQQLTVDSLRSRLQLIKDRHGKLQMSLVSDTRISEIETGTWGAAASSAASSIGSNLRSIRWFAAIAEDQHLESPAQRLAAPEAIGGMRLSSADEAFAWSAAATSGTPSVRTSESRQSWPILISGEQMAFERDLALRPVLAQLYTLCCLLSVAWGRYWTLLDGPHWHEYGWNSAELAQSLKTMSEPAEEEQPTLVALPARSASAYDRLGAQEGDLPFQAISSHYQGKSMFSRYPSFTLLAFIGSIETIGLLLHKAAHCERCSSAKGSRARFLTACSLVVTSKDIRLFAEAYDQRSSTVHSGLMNGHETVFGAIHAYSLSDLANPDSGLPFIFQRVEPVSWVARRLLSLWVADRLMDMNHAT